MRDRLVHLWLAVRLLGLDLAAQIRLDAALAAAAHLIRSLTFDHFDAEASLWSVLSLQLVADNTQQRVVQTCITVFLDR